MASTILLQAQQKRYQNLQPFTGDLSEDVDEYIEQIKSIGSLTKESDEVLHILLKVKLSGKADCWYDNNKDSLGTWSQLRIGLRERFQQTSFSSPHIHDRHQLVFTEQLLGIQHEQNTLPAPVSTSLNISSTSTTSETKQDAENKQLQLFHDNQVECFEDLENNCIHEHEQDRHLPILVNIADPDLNIQQRCMDESNDWNKFKEQQDDPFIKSDSDKTDIEDIFAPFVNSIGSFTADDPLINPVVPQYIQYLSSDKHQPRKPGVFKQVHPGYDWNHYNKKHYDTDNPTPKNVPGYEFNMFYPDLGVHTKTPSYSLTVCEDNRDFSILKFPAGPSYDDIKFKIVHKEWNYSYHYGFRYHFPTGIVQLWFYFRQGLAI